MPNHYYIKALKQFTLTIVGSFVLILCFNLWIDPYNLFHKHMRYPTNSIDKSYLTKAFKLTNEKSNTILIGSSVVDAGFKINGSMTEGTDREFMKKVISLESKLKNKISIYNAGIRGGGIIDIYKYIRFAHHNNPNLNHIILGLAWGPFTYARFAEREMPTSKYLNKKWHVYFFYFKKLFTFEHLLDSYWQLSKEVKFFNKLNHFIIKICARAQFGINKSLQSNWQNPFPQQKNLSRGTTERSKLQYRQLVKSPNAVETATFLFSLLTISGIDASVKQHGDVAALNPVAFDYLKKIVQYTHKHHIKLDVYISPQHATYWQMASTFKLDHFVDAWLRKFAEITPFWDFSGAIDFSNKVNTYFSTDALHFNEKVGEIILPTILAGNQHVQHGIHFVDRNNVEDLIAFRHLKMSEWLDQSPYLKSIYTQDTFQKGSLKNWQNNRCYLIKLSSELDDFTILKLLGNYIAIPREKLPYDLRDLLNQRGGPLMHATSLPKLIFRIKQSKSHQG